MAYGVFAEFYDSLTRNVDYKAKADHICEIFKKFNHTPKDTLDLACGTGTLTRELKKRGIDIYGIDSSYEMLAQARQKAEDEGLDLMFLCQKMQSIDLYGTINTCVCTLDSISHLQGRAMVQKTFDRVAAFTEKDGLFIFDVNTVYKHSTVLGNNTFVYDTDDVYCVWQNYFNEKENSVKINLDFFIPENDVYYRSNESFKEFAYPLSDIEKMLDQSGFLTVGIYDDMTFEEPKENSQRVTFAAKKKFEVTD